MKKILVVTWEYPPLTGGIATAIEGMTRMIPAASVVVLAPPHPRAEEYDATAPYKIIRRAMLFPRGMWPRWARLFFIVRRIVTQEHIDLIMIHHVLPVGTVGFLIKKMLGIPYILFFHGTDVVLASRSLWKRRLVSVIGEGAEQLFFTSEWLRNRFVQIYSDLERKTMCLTPCPEPQFFEKPDETSIALLRERYALAGKKVMLSVGRLTEGKGFLRLLRLLPDLLSSVPNLVWLVVGDGPERSDMVSLVQKLYLQNIVRFVGEISGAELPPFYALADMFVLLTHPHDGQEEALGLVFLEAAAAGIPVVAGRSGGVGEAVVDKQTGLMVEVHQEKQVLDAIRKILHDPAYGQILSRAAHDRVLREFQWTDRMAALRPWIE